MLSIRTQCEILDIHRSFYYYQPATESAENLEIMRQIDAIFTAHPTVGYRMMTDILKRDHDVNRKRIRRLMRKMGLMAIYPKPKTSKKHPEHRIYPYLLKDLDISRPNHVWCADITYIPMKSGFMFLVAVMDWFSRYVISWELSNSLDRWFCIDALNRALNINQPQIFNTDQGVQFTSLDFTNRLSQSDILISMDGRGRFMDNIFIERLWRSLKYEEIYLWSYETVDQLVDRAAIWFDFYNTIRPHSSLDALTPAEVYFS